MNDILKTIGCHPELGVDFVIHKGKFIPELIDDVMVGAGESEESLEKFFALLLVSTISAKS